MITSSLFFNYQGEIPDAIVLFLSFFARAASMTEMNATSGPKNVGLQNKSEGFVFTA